MLQKSVSMRDKFLVLCGVLAFAAPAWAAELNALRDLKVVPTSSGAQVVVSGSRPPTFTVFRLSDPGRLVVDLSSADASGIKGHHDGEGPVSGIVASQFSDERASVGRVLVALEQGSQYDVRADGNRVVISVNGAAAAAATPAEPAKAQVAEAAPAKPEPSPVKVEAAQVAAAPAARVESNVVTSKVDERSVKNPAQKITGLKFNKDTLKIVTDGPVARFDVIELSDPPRLALDVYGVALATKAPRVHSDKVSDLRAGAHTEKVRLVLDVQNGMPAYRAVRKGKGIDLVLSGAVSQPQLAQAEPKKDEAKAAAEPDSGPAEVEIDGQKIALVETAPVKVAPAKEKPAPVAAAVEKPVSASPGLAEIKDLAFVESSDGGKVELKLAGEPAFKVERPDERSAVLTLERAKLPKALERSLDTSALDTPVKMISAFPLPGPGDRVRVVVAADGALEETMQRSRQGLSWKLAVKGVRTEEVAVGPKAAGFTAEAPAYASEGAPRRARYVGKKVSFEFKDIDIHNLLRVIAEVSKKNVVVADDVQGKVTIRLRNVPWDQALELVLRSKGLGKEELGNILRVAPLKTLEEEAKLREERRKALVRQEELLVQLIPVNYAGAKEMADRVKEVLSERGSVAVDARTNVLIIRDIASNIGRARSLVQNLDTQTPQVLIESRIVEAATTFTRQLGVQWGGAATASPGTGNPTGLVFPNTVSVRGGSSQDANAGVASPPNFAVNLPAAVGTGSGGALGFVFGSAGGALNLNLRLSALENQGTVKTISAPKVTTLDNNTARISQGISLPFSQVSAGGVNTTFIEARLSLEVTPHITQDGSILMAIKAENNQPDPSNTGANGQPAIQRKEANTQVLVKDGDTTVIGGIYLRRSASSNNLVPFLGRIPILGFFFRDERETDSRQELLIFITPRIINRQTMAQTL
ncbi:MAG TPA: type IV pilus secretin PilQ [Myxococcaceae bacterium]|nr:type IV pilus secretin PilQ [Myxococcaceae bacterium]